MQKLIQILKEGKIAVIPTDTLYGLVGSAMNPKTVARIYKVRQRNFKKPMIILISSIKDLGLFKVKLRSTTRSILKQIWPGRVSVILSCPHKRFFYLHRGKKTLAFRLPTKKNLISLLKQTGPLVAPSANPEGLLPAKTVNRAKKYFGSRVDFYLAGRKSRGLASTLLRIKNGKIIIERSGAQQIKTNFPDYK